MKKREWLDPECEDNSFVAWEVEEEKDSVTFGCRECYFQVFNGHRIIAFSAYLPSVPFRTHRCKTKEAAAKQLDERIKDETEGYEKNVKTLVLLHSELGEYIKTYSEAHATALVELMKSGTDAVANWEEKDGEED